MTGVIVATIAGVTDKPMTCTSEAMMADDGHKIMMPIATAEIRATGATTTATAPVHLTATLFTFGRAMPGPTPTPNGAEREHRKT